jgi:flagellar hook assembly protein FlgD
MQLDLPERDAGSITIKVYDVAGRRVRTLVDRQLPPGRHEISWDLHDQSGNRVSTGLYFARMEAGEKRDTKRIVVLK